MRRKILFLFVVLTLAALFVMPPSMPTADAKIQLPGHECSQACCLHELDAIGSGGNASFQSPIQKQEDPIVYITNTGKCYHKSTCSTLRKSKTAIKKSEAIKKGYRACSKCKP